VSLGCIHFDLCSDKRPNQQQVGEFRCTAKAIYKITEEGQRVASWNSSMSASPNSSSANLGDDRSSVHGDDAPRKDAKLHRRISMAEKMNGSYGDAEKKNIKESNTDRLRYILEEPGLRSLFREFLRSNFCEENLAFWLDVQDLKRKFNITSSAQAVGPTATRPGSRNTPGQAAMERHHEALVHTTFVIYNTYLAPGSQCELNIDHAQRNELVKHMEEQLQNHPGKPWQGRAEPEHTTHFNATQLQRTIAMYEGIQGHVFRLMATDSVPKFIKTPKFLATRNWVEDFDPTENDIHLLTNGPSSPPGLNTVEEVGGAYITVSQHASEREQRQALALKEAELRQS